MKVFSNYFKLKEKHTFKYDSGKNKEKKLTLGSFSLLVCINFFVILILNGNFILRLYQHLHFILVVGKFKDGFGKRILLKNLKIRWVRSAVNFQLTILRN